ncbi:MAG: hypothetical protein AAF378_13930 [Cyanobacteria bacterium P01_A01_bin.84]
MHTESNYSPLPPSSRISQSQKYVIVRSQRRIFFLKFLLMTLVGWIVGGIASLALEKTFLQLLPGLAPEYQENWLIWSKYISTGIFALIFGADQGLVVCKYISGWWWMLATTVGWLISNHVSTTWIEYIETIAASLEKTLSPTDTFMFAMISTVAYILSGIWLGLCQWLVLRNYAHNPWRWIFLPSFSFLCISVSLIILAQLQDFLPILGQGRFQYFGEQILTALMLGVIPSIALCTFRVKSNSREYTSN